MSKKWNKGRINASKPGMVARDKPKGFAISAAFAASIQAGDAPAGKLSTFEGTAYTGEPMKPMGWYDPVIIDLDGVQVPSQQRPALHAHDHLAAVGHTTSVKVSQKNGIQVAGVFSGEQQHVNKVLVPGLNKFPWQMSVGADPVRTEFLKSGEKTKVNGREVTGPMTISRETILGEVSFVPLGADGDTSARVAAQKGTVMEKKWHLALKEIMAELRAAKGKKAKAAKYSDSDVDDMDESAAKCALKEAMKASDDDEEEEEEDEPPKKKKSESASTPSQIQAAWKQAEQEGKKAAADEIRRQNGITAAARKHGVTQIEIEEGNKRVKVDLAAHAIENDWPVERAEMQAELQALRASRPGHNVGIPGGLAFATASPELSEAVIEAAVFNKCGNEFQLEYDDFYYSDMDTGKGSIRCRRVPANIQDKAQKSFKARYTDQVRSAADKLFNSSMSLPRIMVAAARLNGYTGSDRVDYGNASEVMRFAAGASMGGITRNGIQAGDGASTASLANILANVMNKFALQGYLFTEQAWREVSAIRPVADFKPTKYINMLGDVIFKKVVDDQQITHASLQDQAFSNQVYQYARMLTLARTQIISDDLGMLTGSPIKIGQGAGLAINDAFFTTFNNLANINGDDGNAFWRSTTSLVTGTAPGKFYNLNLISGGSSALSSSSLQSVKQAFDKQVDPNGNPLGFDGLVPIIFFPPELWLTAIELVDPSAIGLVYGGGSASKQPNINLWKGRLKPVMSRYLSNSTYTGYSTTAFYVMFAPTALPVMETAFLNGVDTPTVQMASQDFEFDRLGMSIRGILDFGVNPQNFRGAVKSAGA